MKRHRYTFVLDECATIEVVMSKDFDRDSVSALEQEVLKAAADCFLDTLKQEVLAVEVTSANGLHGSWARQRVPR